MSAVEALVGVLNTEIAHAFTARFVVSPVRIGRKPGSDLVLDHPAIARRHGELLFGPGGVSFRSVAWTKRSFVDRERVRRRVSVELSETSVVTLGPFQIEICLRWLDTWRDGQRDLVTPVRLSFPFGFHGTSDDAAIFGNDDPTVIVMEADAEAVDEELAEYARRLVPGPSVRRDK